jgi:hypothetical protein
MTMEGFETAGTEFPVDTREGRERFLEFAKGLMKAIVDEKAEESPDAEYAEYRDAYSELWDNVRSWEDALDCFEKFLSGIWHSDLTVGERDGSIRISLDWKPRGDRISTFVMALAPYAGKDAYLRFTGEGSDSWSYVFDGKGGFRKTNGSTESPLGRSTGLTVKATVTFQRWEGDVARFNGEAEFDACDALDSMSDEEIAEVERSDPYALDHVYLRAVSLGQIHGYDGPFEVELDEDNLSDYLEARRNG